MPANPPPIEGFARAHERTMQRFAAKAEALFPEVPHPSRGRVDVGDLFDDYLLAQGALATPWWRWEVVFGTMRPRTVNPLRWMRFSMHVHIAKRAIRLAHEKRFSDEARALARGR